MKAPTLLALAFLAVAPVFAVTQTDVEYGTAGGESLKLDLCVPDGAGPYPAVILVHGGGWIGGDKSGGPHKSLITPLQDPLSESGFAWFSINYRLAPKHTYPACIEDVETAIRWVRAHAAKYHIDLQRIALAGESAGGQLVALAAVRATDATRVAAVVPFYAPFDMLGGLKPGESIQGPKAALTGHPTLDEQASALLREASPMFAVKPGLPPFLILHGTADKAVAYEQSVQMLARLREAKVPAELITIEGGPHGMKNWDKSAPDYKARVIAWLKKTLGGS